jgi:hypothetical protein
MAIIIKFKVPRKAIPQVMEVMDADGVPEHNMTVRRLEAANARLRYNPVKRVFMTITGR